MGLRVAVSRFRFREGITSSMSVDCGDSSVLTEALLWANLERDERVLRMPVGDVAVMIFDVSWEILEVRILRIMRSSVCRDRRDLWLWA